VSGRQLYEMYADEMAEQGCDVDAWDDIEDIDKAAWNALAARVDAIASLLTRIRPTP